MKLFSSILVFALTLAANAPVVADPAKVDYGRRHAEFAPKASQQPETSSPSQVGLVEFPHHTPSARTTSAAPAERFPISPVPDVRRDHARVTPDVRREQATPAGRQRSNVAISVRSASAETRTFGVVERFQPRSGSTASVHIGRTPALTRDGTAKLNRFIFRRTEPSAKTAPRDFVRAGGISSASR